MRRRILTGAIATALIFISTSLFAETRSVLPVQRGAGSATAKITSINGNIITITDDQGRTKTLQMVSARGLTVGTKTGWCEEDCGRLKVGDQNIQVQRVVEEKR